MKLEFLPLLIERDNGLCCWYCKKKFSIHTYIFEHLNDNREDNRLENLVLACSSCNNKKPHDFDMQFRAKEKLRQNEDGNFVRERKNENKMDVGSPSTEISINQANYEIAEQYLNEVITADGFVLFSEVLDSIVYLCVKKTGHGSHQSVRNYLATLTSNVAPFKIIKDENKKKRIVKRTEN